MSNRRTYSPLSHTYSYSTNLSPTYSYSRVTTYLDALDKDQTITKLKKELNSVKSVEIKYHTLLQDISLAQKENRLLETRNNDIEKQYIQKVQQTKSNVSQMQTHLCSITKKLEEQQKNVSQAQKEVEFLLEELRKLKLEQQTLESQNKQLQQEVQQCNLSLKNLTEEQQQLSAKKASLHQNSITTSQQMQKNMKILTQLNAKIEKYQEELNLLESQSKRFSLQTQNLEGIQQKNILFLQNLQRKILIQEGQNQQIKIQVNQMMETQQKMQSQIQYQKQRLYENIIRVQQKSMILKETLQQLDRTLESDSTQKKYLRDISSKQGNLEGSNEQLRQILKILQLTYNDKKMMQTRLVGEISDKLKADEMVKEGIEMRCRQLEKLRGRVMN